MDEMTIRFMRRLAFLIGEIGIVIAIGEALVLRFVAGRSYDWRAALVSFVLFFGYLVSSITPLAIALPGVNWLYQHRIAQPEALGVWSFVLLFLTLEFFYYWLHRFGHRVRWFWVTHSVHHTSNDLNIWTSYRIGWTSRLMSNYIVLAPIVLLGFQPRAVFAGYSLILGYQFWIHAAWIPKLGFLEGIINTPSAHRVHHGGNVEYLNANYGAVLLIFDRLFNTYRAERADVPVRYGLAQPLYSYNPLRIAFDQLIPMVRDVLKARSLREAVKLIFGPPEWRPQSTEATTGDLSRPLA